MERPSEGEPSLNGGPDHTEHHLIQEGSLCAAEAAFGAAQDFVDEAFDHLNGIARADTIDGLDGLIDVVVPR